ncbi:hypothetical protein [Terrabacter terrigena]|uniref:Uncharacterized protein n=1 Tax=Terrabacter terrigena TaxID=574718 RepID=A0ABW3MVZ8_9MICO
MFVPRTFIIAGIALIAISLRASGHGLWWLVGLVWALGWTHHGRRACHVGRGRHHRHDQRDAAPQTPQPVVQPDPTHDRHEAFPAR